LSISLKRSAAAALLAVAVAVSAAHGSTDPELVSAKGILAQGDAVFLFAQVSHCATLSDPGVPAAQIFVSIDGGRTWSKKGPELEGNEFKYAYDTKTGLWVAGLHTAEDVADPFILVPGKAPFEWDLRTIYDGPSALGRLAFLRNGDLLARIIHIDHQTGKGRLYLHASSDGGRSWRTVGRAKQEFPKGLREFAEIAKQTADWRIVDRDDSGFAVEHRAGARKPWQTMSAFPVQRCDP
jgi:hypothetical protein